MNLTEKGRVAFDYAKKYFPNNWFSAAELSEKCGEKIAAATLNGIVSRGYMEKMAGSPVKFCFIADIEEVLKREQDISKGCDNTNLVEAKKAKDDEFYTQLDYVNKELVNYKKFFKNKKILLNCNDTEDSAFWQFFMRNFDNWGLSKLTAISYNPHGLAQVCELEQDINHDGYIDEKDIVRFSLGDNGSFDSPESIKILEQSDIVCTNPPFSEFRKYLALLMSYNKNFLIIGSQNAVGYKEIFPLIRDNKIWVGYNSGDMKFKVPADSPVKETRFWIDATGQKWRSLGNICWYTNLPTARRTEELVLTASYYTNTNKKEEYLKYDNYDAINVDKYLDIPKDYFGPMGVPITFVAKYCPEQFRILDKISPYIMGKAKYTRIIIQRVGNQE